ncbi:MAG: hypothetical protein IJS53_03960 [Clostridia bacterium]|nr:hypothetical protein [Clostridia bacterium]
MFRAIKAFLLTLLAYLLQVSVMQHLKIGGVAANLAAVNIAIITVSLGKKHAFCTSCLTGILLEAMTASVGGLYAVLYPVVSMLFAQVFADMSDEKRERRMLRQSDGRRIKGDMNPHLRIPLCAVCITASLEAIFLVYASLSGTELALSRLIGRAVLTVVYTGVLAVLVMAPARWYLGMYGRRVRRAMVEVK